MEILARRWGRDGWGLAAERPGLLSETRAARVLSTFQWSVFLFSWQKRIRSWISPLAVIPASSLCLAESVPLNFGHLPAPFVLITPPGFGPCSLLTKFLFSPFLWFYVQLEAFYSIFTTEQQDHVKSVEYLRNNFRPQQGLNNRVVYKSAVRDAWNHDMTDFLENPLGTEASKGTFGFSALAQRKISLS